MGLLAGDAEYAADFGRSAALLPEFDEHLPAAAGDPFRDDGQAMEEGGGHPGPGGEVWDLVEHAELSVYVPFEFVHGAGP